MKTFPSNFQTESAKKTGASPVWLLKCPFTIGGTKYLSDVELALAGWEGGVTTKAWIERWGELDESLGSGELALSEVSDMELSVINDPNDSQNIEYLLKNNDFEKLDCTLYLWFQGLDASTNPPQAIWVGNITEWEQGDVLSFRIRLNDQLERLNRPIGTKITKTAYPNADPDDVGKISNIGYGVLKNVPARAVIAGALNYLDADITASATTLTLVDASAFPASGTVGIDSEKITYTGKSGNTLTGLTRGASSTTATTHKRGATVWEERTDFTYEAFGHPIKQFDKVYAEIDKSLYDITSQVTSYTGQTGSQHPTYPNKAMLVISSKVKRNLLVDLAVSTGSHGHSGNLRVDVVCPDTYISGGITPGDENYSKLVDGNSQSYMGVQPSYPNVILQRVKSMNLGGLPTRMRLCSVSGHPIYTATGGGNFYLSKAAGGSHIVSVSNGGTKQITYGAWVTLSGAVWGDFTRTASYFSLYAYATNNIVYEVWLEVEYNPEAPSNAATGVAMSGNSVADTAVADRILIDAQGYQDDASGTFTGTANALIERPDHVLKHFLYTFIGWPTANFYTNAGTQFSTKNYKFSALINEYENLSRWVRDFALQSRCRFRFASGQARLLWRPDSITSQKTLTADMVKAIDSGDRSGAPERRIYMTPFDEVINKISVHFNKDWSKSGEDSYKDISETSDATSIAKYGEKQSPELFYFDFVTDSAMAQDLRDHYLAYYKNRKRLIEQTVFLDNADVEFMDGVTQADLTNLLCEVAKMNFAVGDGNIINTVRMLLREA